jgi:hypothetical protein
VLKTVAVLVWLGSVVAFTVPGIVIMNNGPYANVANLLIVVLSDSMITTGLFGFVVGFLLFGVGEIITLLNDIRKNTR